jgi:hypothetical protein
MRIEPTDTRAEDPTPGPAAPGPARPAGSPGGVWFQLEPGSRLERRTFAIGADNAVKTP